MRTSHSALQHRGSRLAVVALAAALCAATGDLAPDLAPETAPRTMRALGSALADGRDVPDAVPSGPACPRDRVVLIAHRGTGDGTRQIDGRMFSENTVPAFLKAMEEGVDGVEADYWTTSDGAVVIHHDDTVDRMTDGTGPVAGLARDEVAALRHPSGAAIPGLAAVGAALQPYGAHRQQEIKEGARFGGRVLRRMVTRDVRQVSHDRLLYTSSEVETLRRITTIDPLVRVGLIHRSDRGRPAVSSVPAWVDVVLIDLLAADAGYVSRARQAGLEVSLRRVQTGPQLHRAVALGARRVVTDRPEVLGTAC